MKACPYCGAEYADDMIKCPIDRTQLGAPPSPSRFRRPAWFTSLIRRAQALPPGRTLRILWFCSLVFVVVLLLSTAEYHYTGGVFQIRKPPLFQVDVAPSTRWMVRSGINYDARSHIVEFPILPGYRMGIQVLQRIQ